MDIHIRSFILEVLYPVFLFFFLILLRLLRGVNKIFCSSKKQVCIYPPAGAGSVGDEAMMEALIASFNAEDVKNITILTIEDGNPWDLKRVDHYYKLSNRYIPLRIIYFSWIIHKYDEFYLLGADMMDGYYSASGSINRIRLANIAAKIGARLQPELAEAVGDIARTPPGQTWQDYRDQSLCQAGSVVALLFSSPLGSEKYHHRQPKLVTAKPQEVRVMSGHQYCLQCFPALDFEVIDQDFKLSRLANVIDSPYFDYRQLSNRKLEKLIVLIQSLLGASTVSNLGAS